MTPAGFPSAAEDMMRGRGPAAPVAALGPTAEVLP